MSLCKPSNDNMLRHQNFWWRHQNAANAIWLYVHALFMQSDVMKGWNFPFSPQILHVNWTSRDNPAWTVEFSMLIPGSTSHVKSGMNMESSQSYTICQIPLQFGQILDSEPKPEFKSPYIVLNKHGLHGDRHPDWSREPRGTTHVVHPFLSIFRSFSTKFQLFWWSIPSKLGCGLSENAGGVFI